MTIEDYVRAAHPDEEHVYVLQPGGPPIMVTGAYLVEDTVIVGHPSRKKPLQIHVVRPM